MGHWAGPGALSSLPGQAGAVGTVSVTEASFWTVPKRRPVLTFLPWGLCRWHPAHPASAARPSPCGTFSLCWGQRREEQQAQPWCHQDLGRGGDKVLSLSVSAAKPSPKPRVSPAGTVTGHGGGWHPPGWDAYTCSTLNGAQSLLSGLALPSRSLGGRDRDTLVHPS